MPFHLFHFRERVFFVKVPNGNIFNERARERQRERDRYIYILYIFMFTDLSCDLSRGRFVELTWPGCAMIYFGRPAAGCFKFGLDMLCSDIFLRSSFTQHERGLDRYGAVSLLYILYIQYAFVLTAFIFIKLVVTHNITRV